MGTTPLNALIIGAGSIGGLIDSPDSEAISSHAHAYAVSPDTKLIAICEPYETNVLLFQKKWGKITCYTSLEHVPEDSTFEIASIASSTAQHAEHLLTLLERPDCFSILCEKPLVATAKEFRLLKKVLKQTPKKILIHLMRRYNPSFIALSDRLRAGEFGHILGFSGTCTKGLLHNGSHLLGVLTHFFGKITALTPIYAQRVDGDLCGDFAVGFDRVHGVVNVLNDPGYSFFELTLWYENSVIKIIDGGQRIEILSKIPSPHYEGYFTLELTETIQTDLSRYALHSLEFLLRESDNVCRAILKEHLHLHKMIFKTFNKENLA
ncbi:Gfo/Idh/MocA family protein [Sulfuricurvum sp.]|uniref:Gfo/Idh/MocA family protein n=1 Tax=Sulfuricurvum sp. TaxID=2025608 RepID=UPI003C3B7BF1